jgi:hypothetical protein
MFKTTQEQLDVENPCSNHTKKMSQFGLLLPRRKKQGREWMGTRPSQDTLHFKSFSMSSLGSISTFSSISTWLVALLAQKLCPVPKSPDYKNSKSLPKPSKNITRAQPSTPQTTNLITQKDNHKSKKKLC